MDARYELGQPRNFQNGGMRFPARFFRVGSWDLDTWSACVLQVCAKLSLFDFFFFVSNPYICKFWIWFLKKMSKKIYIYISKRLSFGYAWNTHADHVSKFQLPTRKNRAGNRIFRFGLKPWVQGGVEYIGKWGVSRTVQSWQQQGGWLPCCALLLIPPQEKIVSSPFSPYSKTYIKCGGYTLFWWNGPNSPSGSTFDLVLMSSSQRCAELFLIVIPWKVMAQKD